MSHPRRTFRLRVLGIALFTVLAGTIFFYFLGLSGVNLLPRSTYTLHAGVADIVSLTDHADVLQAGVKVGSVDGISQAGGGATLTLSLDKRYAPVYRDGQVLIRGKTLIGENYVDLNPGTPGAGAIASGGALHTASPEATQLDQILSTLDAPHRRDVQRILDVLAAGFGGHGSDLNRFLGGTSDLVNKATPVGAVLATDRTQTAALIDDFGQIAGALGQRATDIRRLVIAGRVASQAVADRDQRLRETLRALPGFLSQARTTVAHLGTFSTSATPVMHDLRLATTALIPAIIELRPAARQGTTIVHELGSFADAVTPAAAALRSLAPVATQLMAPLAAILRQANPALAYLAPYAQQLGWQFAGMRGPSEFHDTTGGYGRVAAVVSGSLLTGAFPPAVDKVIQGLINAGILGPISKLHSNPYPTPRTGGHPTAFSGAYPRIQPDRPYTIKH
jgi:phospholipid/cholesterol/gamma-HCH transport system substrate-binding protein